MARPKSVSDEAILEGALWVLEREGPEALTFSALGRRVGLAPATLVQRFTTKEKLLQAAMLHGWDRLYMLMAELDGRCSVDPAGAVAMLVGMTTGPSILDENDAVGLAVLREDMRDPVLRGRGKQWRAELSRYLGRRLSTDADIGVRLGRLLASQWQGALLWWGFERDGPAEAAIEAELKDWCSAVLGR